MNFIPNEEVSNRKNVEKLITHYLSFVEPNSEHNRFRGVLYKKSNQNLPADQKKFFNENIPKKIDQKPVDIHKWCNAIEENPMKEKLVPYQVSSVAELKERTLYTL